MSEKDVSEIREALKSAGRGGWRVELEKISKVAAECLEREKKKYSAKMNAGSVEIIKKPK